MKRIGMPPRVAYPRASQWHDTGPLTATKLLVLTRDNYSCVCCGRAIYGQQYSIQHVKRRSQGGTNTVTNLITLLGTGITACHGRIDSRVDPRDEYRGYTVRSWGDPAATPMWLVTGFGSRWVRRLPDGTYEDADPPEAAS